MVNLKSIQFFGLTILFFRIIQLVADFFLANNPLPITNTPLTIAHSPLP